MHAVDEGLSGRSHELGDAAIGQKHKLLDEPIGLLADFLVDVYRTPGFVAQYLHFRSREVDRSRLAAFALQDSGQFVQDRYGRLELRVRVLGDALDDVLGLFVGETEIRLDNCPAEPFLSYGSSRCNLENC